MKTPSFILAAGAALLLAGCGKRPNVLILTLDTTRADRLGCYGYAKAATPCLDRLAEEGVLFERAQSVMPLTLPTHATFFTGLLPIEHGVRENGKSVLPEDIPTLAERLKEAGYATCAVVATKILDRKFGLDRGFDRYDVGEGPTLVTRDADTVTDTALGWLSGRIITGRPWFLWAHYYDPHIVRELHRDIFGNRFTSDYDAEIAFMDLHIARLVKWLKRNGAYENTLVVAVADHGEGLGEHGEELHGFFIYQSTQHVPLIFRLPGGRNAGARIKGSVSVADLMPTVLELAGVEAKKGKGGRTTAARSFAAAVRGEAAFESRECHMEAVWTYTRFGWSPLSGVVGEGWSYIRGPEAELYDLTRDPCETNNLARTNPRLADERELELERFDARAADRAVKKLSISLEDNKRLASLGYLSGGSDVPRAGKGMEKALPDHKRFPGVVKAFSDVVTEQGLRLTAEENLASCLLLERTFPDKPVYRLHVGRAYLRLKAYDKALDVFSRMEPDAPEWAEAIMLEGKALVYAQKGDVEQARAFFEKAHRAAPEDGTILRNFRQCLAWLSREAEKKGDEQKAGQYLEQLKALERDFSAER